MWYRIGHLLQNNKMADSDSFYKHSNTTRSYRGELLGILPIHLVLLATEEYYTIVGTNTIGLCDNKETLYMFKRRLKRILARAKMAKMATYSKCCSK